MKRIYRNAMLAIMAVAALSFMGCKDDNESNPTLTQPTQFVLNNPALADAHIDLAKSETIELTWSQPTPYTNYNAPVTPTYTVQLSTKGSFTTEYDADAEDNSAADYISLDETYSFGVANVSTATIARALEQLNLWEEDQVPSTQQVSVRVKSAIRDASFAEYYPIYSNVVNINTVPYYVALKAADPELWWLIGSDICDGSWGGDKGKCVIPMQTISDAEYDKKTGQGEIQWIGYLAGNGFKLRGSMDDNWATQWGQGDSFGSFVKNDGGSGNITVPKAGYYTVSLNTKTDKLSIEAYDGTPKAYDGMAISGSFNGWSDEPMSPCFTFDGAVNHDWYITHTFAAGDEVKIKQAGSWDFNKGGSFIETADGMYVYGVSGGDNLLIGEEGTYLIIFNDITGYIRFIKQ